MASTIAKTKTGIAAQAKITETDDVLSVMLHSTKVFHYDKRTGATTLRNGGWVTPTTARVITQCFNYIGLGYSASIKQGQMYLNSITGEKKAFADGVLAFTAIRE